MRRKLSILLVFCLALSGCAAVESPLQPAVNFRSALVSAGGCTFVAEIRADFGDYICDFALEAEVGENARTHLRVRSPETIEGITATVCDDGATIDFDGLALEFGLLVAGQLSPLAAPALAAACWMNGYIVSGGTQEGVYHVSYRKNLDGKEILADTWLKKDVPICVELCYNNQRILQMVISDFKFR